jgi:hypothetical protein
MASLWLAAALLNAAIKLDRPIAAKKQSFLRDLFAGVGFVRRNPPILGSISLDLFAVLLGGATALLPIYARDILHTGPWALGALRGAPAVGALLMALVLTRYPINYRVGMGMFQAVIVFGAATVVCGELSVRQRILSARRVRKRHCGLVLWCRPCRGAGRHRHNRRGLALDEIVSVAARCRVAGIATACRFARPHSGCA